MLAKSNVAIDQWGLYRRKLASSKIFLAKQSVHRTRRDCCEKHALWVRPPVRLRGPTADKYWTRRAERDQVVGIHRQVIHRQRAGIFKKIASHPMVFACASDISFQLSKIAPVKLGSAFARRTDISDREARIICHGYERCLAISRMAFESNFPRIH